MYTRAIKIYQKACIKNIKYTIFCVLLVVYLAVWFWVKNKEEPSGALSAKRNYFVPLQLSGFSQANIPYLMVDIDKRQFNAQIDLGFSGYVSLPPNVWANITEKKFLKCVSRYGVAGKLYQHELYQVKNIHIQKMNFSPVLVEELKVEWEADINLGELKEGPEPEFGRIGWYLFRSFNLLIDAKHSMLALCDGLQTLRSEGYPVESFVSIPLLLDRGLLEFEAVTSSGKLRCVLDTGSTLNLLNKHENEKLGCIDDHAIINPNNQNLMQFEWNNKCELANYIVGDKEFGPITFNQIKSPVAFEAIMGIDFFESHLVFVDFKQQRLYLYKYPEEE